MYVGCSNSGAARQDFLFFCRSEARSQAEQRQNNSSQGMSQFTASRFLFALARSSQLRLCPFDVENKPPKETNGVLKKGGQRHTPFTAPFFS